MSQIEPRSALDVPAFSIYPPAKRPIDIMTVPLQSGSASNAPGDNRKWQHASVMLKRLRRSNRVAIRYGGKLIWPRRRSSGFQRIMGHRRESRTLKAQIPVLRKHACQHRFATFAGILVLGAFCPCSKFAQLGHGKVRAKGVPARHGRLYKKRTFRAYRLPKRCIFATLLKKRRRSTNGTEGRANGEA